MRASLLLALSAGCLLLVHCFPHVAHDYLFGIVVPVVPCGRRVVISGFLAGGTPGSRNVLCVFCTLPERLAVVNVSVLGVVSIHARLNHQHISCWNSHRAVLSTAIMWFFLFGFLVLFLLCLGLFVVPFWFSLVFLFSVIRIWTTWTAYRSMLSFDTPKRE